MLPTVLLFITIIPILLRKLLLTFQSDVSRYHYTIMVPLGSQPSYLTITLPYFIVCHITLESVKQFMT